MTMPVMLTFETVIRQSREVVFDLLVDLRRYDDWLPHSIAFEGTTSISDGPIRAGSTYVESSRWGTRRGIVTDLDRPARVSYRQPMTLRPLWFGGIDIALDHVLDELGPSTRVMRTLKLELRGPARLLRLPVVRSFKTENERMMAKLKNYAESLPRVKMS